MEVLTTNGVTIQVDTFYQAKHSHPKENRFIHAYQITIKNENNVDVKLTDRHWYIVDAHGNMREVSGEGVIGKQPELAPMQEHKYVSWSPIPTDLGKMYGYYTFLNLDTQETFLVSIPEFKLTCPAKLN